MSDVVRVCESSAKMKTTLKDVTREKEADFVPEDGCEMAAVSRPAARAMEVGMFAAANGGDGTTRACAGTRAEIMPLACAASAEELLETVAGMRVRVETRAVAFYHDCVARNARRMSSDEVSRRFRGVVARWSARGLDDSRDERSNAMSWPSKISATLSRARPSHRRCRT